MSALPLSGIKILDLTRVLAGPLSAQMLADLGAEVIKIERPGGGDDARAFGPPYLVDPEGKANNNNSFYLCANRGKKSVTVNIASTEGQDIIRELAKSCDVMMENYKVGDLKRYRLDYESIRAINPGIIYCSVTGFGQTGPYAPRAGYDAILQAMGGLMSVTGHLDGEPGAGPMKVGPSIVDYMTGMNTSIGILAALYHRKANGGEGQHVDVCLFDTVIASLSHWAQIYLVNGQTPPRRGTWGNGGMPAGVFRCTDGELMLVVGNDGQFARTCAVLGAPELATDSKFLELQACALLFLAHALCLNRRRCSHRARDTVNRKLVFARYFAMRNARFTSDFAKKIALSSQTARRPPSFFVNLSGMLNVKENLAGRNTICLFLRRPQRQDAALFATSARVIE